MENESNLLDECCPIDIDIGDYVLITFYTKNIVTLLPESMAADEHSVSFLL